MLDKLWDDVVAGPQPARGLGKLRQKLAAQNPLIIQNSDVGESSGGAQAGKPSSSTPSTPTTPATPTTPTSARAKHDVWRSVFNPGSNLATRRIGAEIFDKPKPNSPSVYDWLYSGETRSTHR